MTETQAPATPRHRHIPIIYSAFSKLKLLKACISQDETRRAINLLGVAGGFIMATNGNIAIRMPFSAFAGLGENDLEEGQSYTTYKTHDGQRGFLKVDDAPAFPNMQAVIDTIKPTWSFDSFTGDAGSTNRQELFYTLFKQAGHMLNPAILEDILPPRTSVKVQGSANPLNAVIFTMGDSKIEIIAMPFKAAEKKD
jgi:hypothetical protein